MIRKLYSILDEIIERNRAQLHEKIEKRRMEMGRNNFEHLSLYSILGFSEEEGLKVDLYQNIGRFLYRYAGALLAGHNDQPRGCRGAGGDWPRPRRRAT